MKSSGHHWPETGFEEVRTQRSFDESSLPRTGLLARNNFRMRRQLPGMQDGSSGTGRYCAGGTILHLGLLSSDIATVCLAHVKLQPVFRFVPERL
jgi:hypothetical protein